MEIPFCTLVEVKLNNHHVKAEDLRCTLETAEVSAQVTEIPKRDRKDKKDRDDCDDDTFDRIIEKDVIRVVVKVERIERLLLHADECPPNDC